MTQTPVIFYEDISDEEFSTACSQAGHVGLTHIRFDKSDNILICFTTRHAIYVLDTKQPTHLSKISQILTKDEGIKFYTTRAQMITYRLFTWHKVSVNHKIVIDLPTYDAFLQMRKLCFDGRLDALTYNCSNLSNAANLLAHKDRVDLIDCYLDVQLGKRDFTKERQDLVFIRENKKSPEGRDVIRKLTRLVDVLAVKMRQSFENLIFQDGTNLYSFAHQVRGDAYIEYENLGDNLYSTVKDYLVRPSSDF